MGDQVHSDAVMCSGGAQVGLSTVGDSCRDDEADARARLEQAHVEQFLACYKNLVKRFGVQIVGRPTVTIDGAGAIRISVSLSAERI